MVRVWALCSACLLATGSTASALTGGGRPGRQLDQVDLAGEDAQLDSFIDAVEKHDPAGHILRVYDKEAAPTDFIIWLATATRSCSSEHFSPANVVDSDSAPIVDPTDSPDPTTGLEEDGRTGDDTRRLLAHHSSPEGDSDGDSSHGDKDKSKNSENTHSLADASSDASSGPTYSLRVNDLRQWTQENDRKFLERSLMYMTACRVDSHCRVDIDVELEEEEDKQRFWGIKVLVAFLFFLVSAVFSYTPIVFRTHKNYEGILTCMNVFSGGIFLTVGLTHLLPHVAEYEELAFPRMHYPVGLAFVVGGFMLILFVEQVLFQTGVGPGVVSDEDDVMASSAGLCQRTHMAMVRYQDALLTEFALVVHAVLEASVLGLQESPEAVWILFAAIATHKVFGSMSIGTRFLRLRCPPTLMFALLLPLHILPSVAILIGTAIGHEHYATTLVLSALSTGTFIYIGAFEVLAEEFGHSHVEAAPPPPLPTGDDKFSAAMDYGGERPVEWRPGVAMKYFMFSLAVAVILGLSAVLPRHGDHH